MVSSLRPFLLAGAFAAAALSSAPAQARDPGECAQKWGGAARSYLTQNRTKFPEDTIFSAACALEGQGKKAEARVEAVMIGARELAKLDARGCVRFMESYVASSKPKDVCDLATGGDEGKLRKAVTDSMPPPPAKRASK